MTGLDPILDGPISEVHTIPVDASLASDEAWAEICREGKRTTFTEGPATWAVIRCDGVECMGIKQDGAS